MPPAVSPGPLMIIGGAEDKLRKRGILTDFVAAAGGAESRIAVIPTASSLGPEVLEVYDAVFRKLGAAEVLPISPESRAEAHDPELIERLASATGIFMTGGNQLKLSGIVSGTPLGEAIVAAHERGVVVAGTSAGASIQSSHMVAFGGPGTTPKQRMTQVAAGLGLVRSAVIDQHFTQRNRFGRLLMIVSQSPQLLGIGVDEDTCAEVTHEDGRQLLTVSGRGVVTIFDPSHVVTDAHEAPRSRPLLVSGVTLHVLPAGASYDLDRRELVPREADIDPEDAAELAEAQRDMRRMARDIALGDVGPQALRARAARTARSRRKPDPNDPTDPTTDGASS